MAGTYVNPVYSEYFADPFVLQHDGTYYAYGTAPGEPEGMAFPVLKSPDLVHWEPQGYALRTPAGADQFWAPEVVFHLGQFFMYYSAHGIDGRDHQLRVAIGPDPLGPFEDAGVVLVPDQPFSIDAHPFRDADGQWYLFYARDFLPPEVDDFVGTGIVVDQLVEMTRLAGNPRLVVRPHDQWQLFQAQREMYGGVYDWHTIEAPIMRVHDDRYFCFYSGGAWLKETYGVSYVVADHPLGPYHLPEADGPIFRTVPGEVIGPGHNSFATSPAGNQEYIVYHAWDPAMTARLMRIDRLLWQDGRPALEGPTYGPQPLP